MEVKQPVNSQYEVRYGVNKSVDVEVVKEALSPYGDQLKLTKNGVSMTIPLQVLQQIINWTQEES
jgi:hypothetical protein